MTEGTLRIRSTRRRRAAKAIGLVFAAFLAAGAAACLLLSIPAVRSRIASAAISRLDAAIPGNVTIRHISSPSIGAFEFAGISWVDGPDSMVTASRLSISANLLNLFDRGIRLESVVIEDVSADVPAIQARFRKPKGAAASEAHRGGAPPGTLLPRLPSLAVDRIRVTANRVRVGDTAVVNAVMIDGGVDMRQHGSPWVRVDTLAAKGSEGTWRIDGLSLYVAPDRGVLRGRGSGGFSPYWPVAFSISPLEKDHFAIDLTASGVDSMGVGGDSSAAGTDVTDKSAEVPSKEKPASRGAAFVHADLTIARDAGRLRALSFHGKLRTPGTVELSNDPATAPRVARLPTLDGLLVNFWGQSTHVEKVTADIRCTIDRNNWIDGGEIALRYVDGAFLLDEFAIAMPDLSITGTASVGADSIDAAAKVRVSGATSLRTLFPDLEPPEPLSASIDLTAALAVRTSILKAGVSARATAAAISIDQFRADAEISLDDRTPSSVVLTAGTAGLHIGIAGIFRRTPDIVASLTPVVVQESPIPRGSLVPPIDRAGVAAGKIRYSTADKSLEIDALQVRSDFGDGEIDASIDGSKSGVFTLRYGLRTPPPPLVRALKLTPGEADSLAAQWSPDAPFRIAVDGKLISVERRQLEASGSFSLPGPRNMASIFPDSVNVRDLGPLAGSFSISTKSDSAGLGFAGTLDLTPTSWIDASVVRVHGASGAIVIDTLSVVSQSVQIGLKGEIAHGAFNLSAIVAAQDSLWVRRIGSPVSNLGLRGRVDLKGTSRRPALKADLEGSIKGPGYDVPAFTASVDVDTARAAAVIRAPAGIRTRQVRLHRALVKASSTGENGGLLPVRVSLVAVGEKLELHQSMRADTTGGLNVDVDTLSLTLGNQDLRLRKPVHIFRPAGSMGISVDDLDLAGSMGTIRASARLRGDSSNVAVIASIVLPDTPPPAFSRPHLWPRQVDLELHATGASDVDASLDVNGFMLVDQRRPRLHVQAGCHEGRVAMELSVADSSGEVVGNHGSFPATVRIYPPSFALQDGPVSFEASLNSVPIVARYIRPTERIPQDEILRISGRAVAGGTSAAPIAVAKLSVGFTDWPKLSEYRGGIEAALGSREDADSLRARSGIDVSRELTGALAGGSARELAASFELERGGQSAFSARVVYPLDVSLYPPMARKDPNGRIDARVESKDLPLDDLDPFLPLNIGLGGLLSLELTGKGPVGDFALNGSLGTKDLEVSVAEQARFVARSNVSVSGSKRRPVIKGNVEVTTGLIRVPDRPKHLHDIEGDALLWPDSLSRSERDTTTVVPAEPDTAEAVAERAFDTDLDISIHIPSGFWIRGKGLDIELSGDLTVKQKGGKPIVSGELRAIRGTLIALGRTLDLERGTVTFYGGDEMNPSLDIVLTTDIDGTKIEILFGGTAQKPRVNLTSEPEMSETDIMAVLLFGRTFEALDDDEADLVKRRSAEMIASLGAAKLQEEVGGQLGVDVVTIKDMGMGDESSALSLGKYLNPRTVLSYAYSLDSDSRSFVSLEYFLKGRFVVVSTYDNLGVGSLGVGWSKDY